MRPLPQDEFSRKKYTKIKPSNYYLIMVQIWILGGDGNRYFLIKGSGFRFGSGSECIRFYFLQLKIPDLKNSGNKNKGSGSFGFQVLKPENKGS